jgi:hypothetical protein
MELISPLLIYSVAIDLQRIHDVVAGAQETYPLTALVAPDDCKVVAPMMAAVRSELIKLNCTNAARSAAKPEKLMAENRLTYGLLLDFTREMDGRFRDEVDETYAFSLNPMEAAFFNPAIPLFRRSCWPEIRECGVRYRGGWEVPRVGTVNRCRISRLSGPGGWHQGSRKVSRYSRLGQALSAKLGRHS